MTDLIARFGDRIGRARTIADQLRHDEQLHRLAMATVFVLEDTYEALILRERSIALPNILGKRPTDFPAD